MNKEKQLVFLCGSLRSGTTVLGLMFRYHPIINAPGERDFLFDFLNDDLNSTNKDMLIKQLQKDRLFNSLNLTIRNELTANELIRDIVTQTHNEKPITLINAHRNFEKILKLFPNSHFIHLLRDPRDVSRSSIGMGWAGNVYYGVDHWIDTEKSWDMIKTRLNKNKYIECRFEDVIRNTKAELTRLCDFLEIPFSNKMLDYPKYTSYSLPNETLTYQWKRKLSDKEACLVENKVKQYFGDMRGYQIKCSRSQRLTLLNKIILFTQNKIYKQIFAIKRYGIKIYFAEKITRLIKLEVLHKNVILKKNEIDKIFLK